MKVTKEQFVEVLKNFQGDTIELLTLGKPTMRKGGTKGTEPNPYYDRDVRKRKHSKYAFGKNYLTEINEALKKEGKEPVDSSFTDNLPWGEYKVKNKVITYNGELYLRCYPTDDPNATTEILIDNVPATKDELAVLEKYLPKPAPISKKQLTAGISAPNSVRPLMFNFGTIESAVIDNVTYEII